MVLRSGQYDRVRRRAMSGVRPVDFLPNGCTKDAEITQYIASDVFEYKGSPASSGFREYAEIALIAALCDKSHAHEALRRPSQIPPDSAQLAGEGEMLLANLRHPCTRAGAAAPNLDDSGQRPMTGATPIKAVAAQIQQSPTVAQIGLDRLQLRGGVILRMVTGHDDP